MDANNVNVLDLIAKRLAAPKNFRIVTTFADGATYVRETETRGQAENWATGERRKIGRDLISRATGEMVHVVSVEIERI